MKAFAEQLLSRFSRLIKAIWLLPNAELSVVTLLDDTKGLDLLAISHVKTEAKDAADKVERQFGLKLHLLFYLLTDYWELVRHGSPVTFTEIRDGIPVYDPSGFFVPLKKLLAQGRIPGTKEAMKALIEQAPIKLLRIEKVHSYRIIDELASAVVDAGQAPLLMLGIAPPAPKELVNKLELHLVKKKLLEPEFARYADDVIRYYTAVRHREIKEITGEKIDEMLGKASKFVDRMQLLIEKLTAKG